jgi:hypothetical protein
VQSFSPRRVQPATTGSIERSLTLIQRMLKQSHLRITAT